MAKITKLSSDRIIEKAKDYFDHNLGLKLVNQTDSCCLEFQSNLGFVILQIFENDKNCEVNLTTREYENQIQDFLGEL